MKQTGKTLQAIISASRELGDGKTVVIMALNEDNYAERMSIGIKNHCGIEVEITRLTKRHPTNNRKLLFDEQGEVRGIDILPQTDKFIGWKLKKKQ